MSRTVLITGSSRGIGREIARAFAQNGDKIAVNYFRHKEQAAELVREIRQTYPNSSALAVRADVCDQLQVRIMFEQVKAQLGTVEVLVNNAGIAQQKLFTDITEQDWDNMFNVDVKGIFHCCQCALPDMIHCKEGKIINISSMWGQVGASCEVHYSAAKAAVIGLTQALAKEVGPSHIQVNCIAPGVIDTEMNGHLDAQTMEELKEETPLGVIGTPKDIAEAALFLASDKADFITGQVLGVNGGMII